MAVWTKDKTTGTWSRASGVSESYGIRNPDWSRVISYTTSQLYAGITMPDDGIFSAQVANGNAEITINSYPVARGFGRTVSDSAAQVQIPVTKGDIAKSTSADLNSGNIYFVPFKTDSALPPGTPIDNALSLTSENAVMNKIVTSKMAVKKTLWTGSVTKGGTCNVNLTGYDLVTVKIGGAVLRAITDNRVSSTRIKAYGVWAGRDNAGYAGYEQFYLLDILNSTVLTCGWFDLHSLTIQNSRLAGQQALALALAGDSNWTDPAWKYMEDVETNVSMTEIIGYKFSNEISA